MRGKSTGHSRSRPRFGRKTFRRCMNSEESDEDVILIDVDSDHFDNVMIIDVPDSLPKKRRGSSILMKDKSGPLQTVIYIDDDEESPDKFNSFAGASSCRSFKPPEKDFEDVDAEENPFIQKNTTPVRLSKCKRTYSGKASAGKGYGLNLDSENNSYANYHPDCELMEDISGKVEEQWKKAFYRRKKGIKNIQSGIRSQNGASRNDSIHQTVGRKSENDNMEAPHHFDTGKFSNQDKGTSPLSEEEDAYYNSTYVSVGGSSYRGQHSPSIHTEPEDHKYFESGSSSCHNGKIFKKSSSYSSHNEQATKEVKKTKSRVNVKSDYGKASSVKDEVAISKGQNSVEVEADIIFFPTHEFRESHVTATGRVNEMEHLESCDPHESESLEKTYNLTSVRSSYISSTLPDKQMNCSCTPSSDAVEFLSGESSWFHNSLLGSRDGIKKGCHREIRRTVDVIPLSGNINFHINDAKVGLDESVSNSREDKDGDFHPENGHAVDYVESCMLCEREKFKETDEYERALEEEWASRQQALKIQAEEAPHFRRLQKRRKAETMRLMDMKRRQKERIEEMRSTQKKDEEKMNLKEVIRAEVRKELNKLEMTFHNMSSLLHSFGIQIEGWPNPSPQEVQTAYKKALLTFHPDRALQSDIRQQVEAEEKFKIINRFKEKYAFVL
ncbi:uncharacterized protein [Primulina eburnea]|uniref:uncharacterized protein isoform X2 n=1 Tax=Primulina eburnea TaxID=1245227 RepID=UPI003C6C7230